MIDFEKVFNTIPANYAILDIDYPKFTVLAVNESYLKATETTREDVIGRGLFEAYPDDPKDSNTVTNSEKVSNSIMQCIKSKSVHQAGIMRYDIRVNCTREFEVKYWSPTHIPLLDENGEVKYVIEAALDITDIINMGLRLN